MTQPDAERSGVLVRAIEPDDAGRLLAFHAQLSTDTTYSRFFGLHPQLSDVELRRFTHVDHHDLEALVAIHDGEIIGVSRFDQFGDGRAEAAFVVRDDWQNRGLGHLLLRHFVSRARVKGIQRLVAATLTSNTRMLAVFRGSGLVKRMSRRDGVVSVELDLTTITF